ncbi:ATP-dependent nuclease, subunit B [Fructilactobacillus florum 8D]|uniref:ATP-dependent nuclease, subunit B n=2 Tax=Fructilactobacillus florum TaxID=640331 RepID=W9EGY8_9LACO|nr:PD-(D/E)XK nuclease family protein [Fructilactobacillus florum]ETO40511.1 ATP-dependent nuclease, subunit B [Fructilactobacillus florum 8D]KRM91305.1 ATP-dependent helicase deoxyribonuclease subunit B [Fructilactobacillus florum DSM 22689 = JCM 16035]
MTLKFILGPGSADHAGAVIDDLQHQMAKKRTDTFFYVVPNNVKFESELQTLRSLNQKQQPVYAQNQLQIFSFSRLVWYFLNTKAAYQLPKLSPMAINMIIYQIIEDRRADLTVYRGEGKQAGFIQQVADQLMELQQGGISADNLAQLSDLGADQVNPELHDKLHDLQIIYQEFVQRTDGQYLYQAELLELLNEYLLGLDDAQISTMHFYFSQFKNFSARELQIIQTLITRAQVTIDLNLTQAAIAANEESLFAQPTQLYHYLTDYAEQHAKKLADRWATSRSQALGLQQLEEYWIASNEMETPLPPSPHQNDALQVSVTKTAFAELMQLATEIRRLVATGNYRYRDILVTARQLDQYQSILQPVFSMLQIPYFTDNQQQMDQHPLVGMLASLLAIDRPNRAQNYRYDDVMALLKSELLLPQDDEGHPLELNRYRRAVALCENLVLKNGYQGKRWTQAQDWMYAQAYNAETGVVVDKNQQLSKEINLIRHFIKNNLPPFYRQLKQAPDGKTAATVLYRFLVNHGVPARLQEWQTNATEAGQLQAARQSEQVWDQFCQILDDYVAVLGQHEFVVDDFWSLLQAGFVGASYSQIPSTLDQVTISEAGRVHLPDKKITFILGADDTNFPAKIDNQQLLTDGDRDQLEAGLYPDQYLQATSTQQMLNEPYDDYLLMMTPSDRLYFSYNLGGDVAEQQKQLSPYVARIQNYFDLPLRTVNDTPTGQETNLTPYLGTARSALHYLLPASLASKKAGLPLSSDWQQVQTVLLNAPDQGLQQLTKRLLASLQYKNEPENLRPEIVTALYGTNLTTSISKLEDFYQNPYEYFLKYGLQLRERSEFEISPTDTGQFFHEALDQFSKAVREQRLDLAALSDADLSELVLEITTKMIEQDVNYQYEILKSSQRMKYLQSQLIQTVQEMVQTMRTQASYTPARPAVSEVAFGPGQPYAGLHYDLDKQHQLNVQGRIDRIDRIKVADHDYLGVVDYKSGNKKLELNAVYDGIELQLLTYLKALWQNRAQLGAPDAKISGALYMHIFAPVLKPNEVKNWDDQQQITAAVLKKHRFESGILINDPEFIKSLADPVHLSTIYPISLKNDGQLRQNSQAVTPEQLQALLNHTEKLMQQAATRIFAGETTLAPVQYNQTSTLQYSPYKPIMQFDPMLPENQYREIINQDKNTILQQIMREAQQHE